MCSSNKWLCYLLAIQLFFYICHTEQPPIPCLEISDLLFVSGINESGSTEIFIYTLVSVFRGACCLWRRIEISKQPLPLFRDCALSADSRRRNVITVSDTQTAARCSSEILLTASAHSLSLCDCRGAAAPHRWVCCLVCRQHWQIVEIANCFFSP